MNAPLYTTQQAARLLGIGRNELVKKMREWGMLHGDNVPVKKHIDLGRLKAHPGHYWHAGIQDWRMFSSARITVAGMQYIQSKLDKENTHATHNNKPAKHLAPLRT